MKFRTAFYLILPFLLMASAIVAGWTGIAAVALVAIVLQPRQAACFDATFILPMILREVMEAYKTKLPALGYFLKDISSESVKWGQEIIAQMPLIPTARDHVPGNDLTTDAQNVKDLMTEVKMKIDKCKKVILEVPAGDANSLFLDETFRQAMMNSGHALAEAVVTETLAYVNPDTFSNELVVPLAETNKGTLREARVQLNKQKAGLIRYGLAGSDWVGVLEEDPRMQSKDYAGQMVEDNPYSVYKSVDGFREVTEFPAFPSSNNLLAFFFDQRALLVAFRKMNDTTAMAQTLGIPMTYLHESRTDPNTGLEFHAYMWIEARTQKIFVAFVVAFGVTGGRLSLNAEGDQEEGAADSLLDRSGLRIVSASTAA